MELLFWSTLKLFENAFLIQFEQMRMDQKRIFEQFEKGSKSKFEQFWFSWLFFSKSNPNWNMEHRLIFTWFLVDILWKLILTTEIVLIPEMIFQRQKMLFRQKIQSYGPDTNDFREFSIICKLNWERVWYFINNVLFNSKIVIFNQRTNRNEQNGTVHNSTSLIEHRLILLEYILIPVSWKSNF